MNLTHALGWTLIHFLWQGALIAGLLAGVLALLRRGSSQARYASGCAALTLMVICAVVTFLDLQREASPLGGTIPPIFQAPRSIVAFAAGAAAPGAAADYLQIMVWTWFAGVLALSLKWLGGWAVAERFARRQTWPAEIAWEERFAALAERLAITRPVRLAVSTLAQVPAVVGWLKPIVLVPAGVFAGMTAEQIEALLAHELAHVRRYDYLVNLVQTAAETLFFYHPAVWWVSRQIRAEREHCCDDLAVETCGNAVAYVQALTELEQMRPAAPRLAMAANGGSLVSRVQRLLRRNQTTAAPAGWVVGVGVATCLLTAVLVARGFALQPAPAHSPAEQAHDVAPPAAEPVQAPPAARRAGKQTAAAAQAPSAPQTKQQTGGWLDGIQAAGFRDLNVDQLIALKIHEVTGEYIRQMRAAGLQPTADDLVAMRIHDVTPAYVDELKRTGLQDLKTQQLVALKIHDVEPAWILEIQALGYSKLTVDEIVMLRIHEVTPAFIREAEKRGLKGLSLEKLVQLKQYGIL